MGKRGDIDNREEPFIASIRILLINQTKESNNIISLVNLSSILGYAFHIPKELRIYAIKKLVKEKVIIPNQSNRWRDFVVVAS